MKFSYNWLGDFLDSNLELNALCKKLTASGIEVASVQTATYPNPTYIFVGQVEKVCKHPAISNVNISYVNIGEKDLLTAFYYDSSGLHVGMKVPIMKLEILSPSLLPKSKQLDRLYTQQPSAILCSQKDLGLSDDGKEIMILPPKTSIGTDINKCFTGNDHIIHVNITPNRSDCLSVYGIARELASVMNVNLKNPFKNNGINKYNLATQNISKNVILKNPEFCYRYFGRVISGINKNALTPLWMKRRLHHSGIRPISVISDVTNYVLIALGQPIHVFDSDKIGDTIYVRMSKDKEKINLLGKTQLLLEPDTLVISDHRNILAIAGILGGADSSVTQDTENIFLESAYFTPQAISGKGLKYNLSTDALYQFEHGVDPKLCEYAIDYATRLIIEIAGGRIGNLTKLDHYTKKNNTIELHLGKLTAVLGIKLNKNLVESILTSLKFTFIKSSSEVEITWLVTIPSYRSHISIEEDIIEEVGRFYGYQNIPEVLPSLRLSYQNRSYDKLTTVKILKNILVSRSYHEVVNYSFIDPKLSELFFDTQVAYLKNPISQSMSVMRQGLIPGLITTFKSNLNRQQSRIRIFEEGICFRCRKEIIHECSYFSGLVYGDLNPVNWKNKIESDFYSVKSDIESLLHLGRKNVSYVACNNEIKWLHPGKSAYIYQNSNKIGVIGTLHPNVMKSLQIRGDLPTVFELETEKISQKAIIKFKSISKYPHISRDISVILSKDISGQDLIESIKKVNINTLIHIELTSVYYSRNLPANKKSITMNLIFQDKERTLTDDSISKIINAIIRSLYKRYNAVLRSK